MNCKHLFSERVNGKMEFKRGFNIEKGANLLVVEDIVTTGGSIVELIDLISQYDANIKGIICIVNRSEKNLDFKFPFTSLLSLPTQSWEEEQIPVWLDKIPLTKPGSTGK